MIGLGMTIYHLGFDMDQIVSPSMAPTLWGNGAVGGDRVLSERLTYLFRNPKRWEVVRFIDSQGIGVMKRIVGLPGETVAIKDGKVVINGAVKIPPPGLEHLDYLGFGVVGSGRSYICGDGYFVLGDESKDSYDSRFEKEMPPDRILGRAVYIVWPRNRAKSLIP
jgi:signal peptidase I